MRAAQRTIWTLLFVGCSTGIVASSASSQSRDPIPCMELTGFHWSGFTIDLAEAREKANTQPAHCFIQGTIDTEIHFELLLPEPDDWNGRFVMGGGGGYVGSIQNAALNMAPTLLADGFATVGTDTGHQDGGTSAAWALDREDREINFGHRAIHMTAKTAKTIIRLYYGRDIDYSYFMGCSRGGGQAMVESQRYPDDFDGIVAGAPAFDWPGIGAQFVQISQAMYPDPNNLSTPIVTEATRQLLEDAILAKCDALDGLEDGILNDPRECTFRPEHLPRCETEAPEKGCVTSQELYAIKTVYGDTYASGENVRRGFPFGGESDPQIWGAWIAGSENAFGPGHPSLHFAFGTEMFKYIIFDDPEWDYATYDFSKWEEDTRRAARILNATNPDLTAFEVAGGKIIYWTGWSDAALTSLEIIDYYDEVLGRHEDADAFSRLFLMPGVGHCGGGPGPSQVDWLGAIQSWVEQGQAPDRLTASRRDESGEPIMQRPLCPYPAKAVYNGNGDGNELESFSCERE